MDALKALELIEQLETSLYEMYGRLRGMYAEDATLHALFSQLATEEMNHANLAKMQKTVVAAAPGEFADVDVNFSDLRSAMNRVAVVRSMPREKLAEILVQCYLIESSLVEQYVVVSLRSSNKDMSTLLDILSDGFRDHQTALAAWTKEMGGDFNKTEALRSQPRVTFPVDTTINDSISAKGVDISESGIFLRTSQAFREGDIIRVTFPIMNSRATVKAKVRYSAPNAGIGLAFSEISDKDQHLIRQYVDSCLEKQAEDMRKKQNAAGATPPAP